MPCIDRITRTSILGMMLLGGCRKGDPPARSGDAEVSGTPWFADVSDQVGLQFTHDAGPLGTYFFPQTVGSGAAFLDYDNDGKLDIYLVSNGGPDSKNTNKLYHQESDGRFKDVSAGSGLDITGWGMGVAVGDVNNDGLPDLLVTEFGRVRMFLNNGDGAFTDVTKEAGLDSPHWPVSASFVDYDRDGWLDIVIADYADYDRSQKCTDQAGRPDYCGPNASPPTVSRLYHNLGAKRVSAAPSPRPRVPESVPQFQDVTVPSGLGSKAGWGLGVTCLDFDGDGWPDIFVTNDGHPNYLWMNHHDGTFVEEAVLRGVAYNGSGQAQANMGIAIGDVSESGLFDLYVTHLTEEQNIFWAQTSPGQFQDRTAIAGLVSTHWHATGFGDAFADFDNDGRLDLAVANGRVRRSGIASAQSRSIPGRDRHWDSYVERNQLFVNEGQGRFSDVSLKNGGAFTRDFAVGRGLVVGDVFNDGSVDMLVSYAGSRSRLYRNVVPARGHWVVVRAIDPALGGRDAYGATVTVRSEGWRGVRWIQPASSYACSNDPRAHFGLGKRTTVDSIEVLWPDGLREVFPATPADRLITLRRGQGKAADPRGPDSHPTTLPTR